jgi:hypothetical protein
LSDRAVIARVKREGEVEYLGLGGSPWRFGDWFSAHHFETVAAAKQVLPTVNAIIPESFVLPIAVLEDWHDHSDSHEPE